MFLRFSTYIPKWLLYHNHFALESLKPPNSIDFWLQLKSARNYDAGLTIPNYDLPNQCLPNNNLLCFYTQVHRNALTPTTTLLGTVQRRLSFANTNLSEGKPCSVCFIVIIYSIFIHIYLMDMIKNYYYYVQPWPKTTFSWVAMGIHIRCGHLNLTHSVIKCLIQWFCLLNKNTLLQHTLSPKSLSHLPMYGEKPA